MRASVFAHEATCNGGDGNLMKDFGALCINGSRSHAIDDKKIYRAFAEKDLQSLN